VIVNRILPSFAALGEVIRRDLDAEVGRIGKAVETGVADAGEGLKQDLRKQVLIAGLGVRLARAWRSRTYPNKSYDAASLVWSKASDIVRVFDEGTVIKSGNGFWLAIPTPAAPKRGVGGKRINPSNFPEHRFGQLRFVHRRGRPSLLVVDDVRVNAGTGRVGRRTKGGAYTKSGRMKAGMSTVVMFVLVPQVRMPKRLDVERAAAKWTRALPALIDRHMISE
jgi:hypothetical protein